MDDYSRLPTRGERVLGIVLSAALALLFGVLTCILALKGIWTAAAISSALFAAAGVVLCRAAFGRHRALNSSERRRLGWVLVLLGLGGIAIALSTQGSIVHQLMLLGSSMSIFSAGLATIQSSRNRP